MLEYEIALGHNLEKKTPQKKLNSKNEVSFNNNHFSITK